MTAIAWHPNVIPRHEWRLLRHGSAFLNESPACQGVARASPAFPGPWLCWAADQVGQLWWRVSHSACDTPAHGQVIIWPASR